MGIEDVNAKIRALQDADKAAREARDEEERAKLVEEHPEYFGPGYVVEFFPGVRASVPGCVVMRLPTMAEQQRFREACLGQGASVKARALADLVAPARVYPDVDAYREMVKASPGISDQCASVLSKASDGQEREAGKG